MAYGFQIQTTEGLKDVTSNDDIGLRFVGKVSVFIEWKGTGVTNIGSFNGPPAYDASKGQILCWQDWSDPQSSLILPVTTPAHLYPMWTWDNATKVLSWDATALSWSNYTSKGLYSWVFVHDQ